MSYKSQWSGTQIDAAVGGIRAAVSGLKKWKNLLFSAGYDSAPSFVQGNLNWEKEESETKYHVQINFDEPWDLIIDSAPFAYFFEEEAKGEEGKEYHRVNYDYTLVENQERKIIGIQVFSNTNKKIIIVCTNGGGLSNSEWSPNVSDYILIWQQGKFYSQNSIVAYLGE